MFIYLLKTHKASGYANWGYQRGNHKNKISIDTVEPAHAVTSIKQSSVLKGHIFLVLS